MANFNFKWPKNEGGLSLVEVLASLVILGIVFVGFMNIFPQMTLFNKKTETKLETMNLARQEMAIIKNKEGGYSKPLNSSEILLESNQEVITNPDDLIEGAIRFKYKRNDYQYEIDFYTDSVPGLESEKHPDKIALYKVHLKVMVDGKENSESYGYIKAN